MFALSLVSCQKFLEFVHFDIYTVNLNFVSFEGRERMRFFKFLCLTIPMLNILIKDLEKSEENYFLELQP